MIKDELLKQIDHARELKYQYNLKNLMIENETNKKEINKEV